VVEQEGEEGLWHIRMVEFAEGSQKREFNRAKGPGTDSTSCEAPKRLRAKRKRRDAKWTPANGTSPRARWPPASHPAEDLINTCTRVLPEGEGRDLGSEERSGGSLRFMFLLPTVPPPSCPHSHSPAPHTAHRSQRLLLGRLLPLH
jgi:hypothetical protein